MKNSEDNFMIHQFQRWYLSSDPSQKVLVMDPSVTLNYKPDSGVIYYILAPSPISGIDYPEDTKPNVLSLDQFLETYTLYFDQYEQAA
jgi:hypothetical protein